MQKSPNGPSRFTPAVGKRWLYLVTALLWTGVGIFLLYLSWDWLDTGSWLTSGLIVLGGLLLGVAAYRFGFSRMAHKNIRRIEALPGEKHCVFGFHGWKIYPIMAVMMATAIFLRNSAWVPEPILAVIYSGIGLSKFSAGLIYYRKLIVER